MTAEGTPADRFAIEHAHYREDLAMWALLADGVDGPILDLGAAAGRVSLHLASLGHRVVAVDSDPQMVRQIVEAAADAGVSANIRAVCADLRTLDLDERFPLVLLPMNTLQVFLTRDDQVRALRAVHRHLMPESEFIFDVIAADLTVLSQTIGTVHSTTTHHIDDGRTLIHHARFDEVDVESGTVRFTLLIDEMGPDGSAHYERPHTVHLYSPTELWELLADAGMQVNAVYGDFDGSPLEEASERQIFRCAVAQ